MANSLFDLFPWRTALTLVARARTRQNILWPLMRNVMQCTMDSVMPGLGMFLLKRNCDPAPITRRQTYWGWANAEVLSFFPQPWPSSSLSSWCILNALGKGKGASRYDVRIRGGHGKVNIVRVIAWISCYKSVPNVDKWGKEINVDVINLLVSIS